MKIGHINRNTVNCIGYRFDASYHLSEGVGTKRLINKSPFELVPISKVSSRCFIGNRAKRVYVTDPKRGIAFLSSSGILQADLENVKYASKKYTPQIKEMTLEKGWTLISRSGTVGNCAFATAKHAQKLASEHVIRLVSNNILREGVIYAYLASKYGYSLLTQGTFGAVIQHIEPSYVLSLPIPMFPQKLQNEVDNLMQDYSILREEAIDSLDIAKHLIVSKFDLEYKNKRIGVVSSKDIFSSYKKRFEANFYISLGSEIEKYIKDKFEWKSLGELCQSISRPEIFKRFYVKNGITFLGSADIFLTSPESSKKLSKAKTTNIASLLLTEGTILIPRSGTIGDVAMAHAGHAQKLASEHVIRLVPNDILKRGYIYAFLSTKLGKCLIQKHIFGSVIQHIEAPHLSLIPIPILKEEEMDIIDKKVQEYCTKISLAIKKEKLAIKLIEDEIDSWNH